MSSRLLTLGAIAGLVLAGVGGAFAGMQLAERANTPGTQTVAMEAPASAPVHDIALRSAAGFTGFEQDALGGQVTRTGSAAPASDGTFEVRSGGATMTVATTSTVRLYRIDASGRPLTEGDVVVIRVDEAGAPVAALRIPPDLREGDAR
ncbi:MAG: hypothetical protein M0R73_02725 [Dehalococcoidia bacterium]|nr:hypothetical protein [Dehalococcoidia bacterium]